MPLQRSLKNIYFGTGKIPFLYGKNTVLNRGNFLYDRQKCRYTFVTQLFSLKNLLQQ